MLDEYRGKGYATEMLKTLLSWAKNHIQTDRILAIAATTHPASERVMQKAGMTFLKKDKIDNVESFVYEYRL